MVKLGDPRVHSGFKSGWNQHMPDLPQTFTAFAQAKNQKAPATRRSLFEQKPTRRDYFI
jgi:hypothetical protein